MDTREREWMTCTDFEKYIEDIREVEEEAENDVEKEVELYLENQLKRDAKKRGRSCSCDFLSSM